MSVNTQLVDGLSGFPVREAPGVCLARMPQLVQTCCLFPLYGSPKPLYTRTHFQEKRAAEPSGDDHGNTDLSCHFTPMRNTDVTGQYFFQGMLALHQPSSNQECDQVSLCTNPIVHNTNHITEQGTCTSCEQQWYLGDF